MIRAIFAVFLLGLAVLSGCEGATNVGAQKNVSNSNTEILVSNVGGAETPLPIHQIKTKQPLIWVGAVWLNEAALESPGYFSGGDAVDEEFPGEIALGTTVEVDVMNCAGFLATAKITYTDIIPGKEKGFPPGWHLKVVPEKVASDMQEKIKTCGYDSKSPDYGEAFAVAPPDDKRKNIKISEIDTRKLFSSLNKETKVMANTTEKYVGREKNNLTLKNDSWTDIDGDGQIDLVEVSGNCGNKDYTCTLVFLLINGKWKEIGNIGPA